MSKYLVKLPLNPGLRDILTSLFGKKDLLSINETVEYSTFELSKQIYDQLEKPLSQREAREIIVNYETPEEPVFSDFIRENDEDNDAVMALFDEAFTKHVRDNLKKLYPGSVYLIEMEDNVGDVIFSDFVKLVK